VDFHGSKWWRLVDVRRCLDRQLKWDSIGFAEAEFFQGTARCTVFTKVLDRSRMAGL